MVDIPLPINERQTRPLAPLALDQQREAWTHAVETAPNGKVTSAHIQAVVAGMSEDPAWTAAIVQASRLASLTGLVRSL